MKVHVSGGIDVGQSFPIYIEEKFEKDIFKICNNVPGVEVRLKKQGPMIFTSIVINDAFKKGVKMDAEAQHTDPHKSFDEAFKKILTQIKKEKEKAITKKKKAQKLSLEEEN